MILAVYLFIAQALTLADLAFLLDPSSSAACATSDTSLAHDEFLEGWGTPGPENTWTTNSSVNITYDEDADTAARTENKPTGACDTALLVTVNAGSTASGSVYWNRGSAIAAATTVDHIFYLYFTSVPDVTEQFAMVAAGNSSSQGSGRQWWLYVTNAAGALSFQARGSTYSAVVAGSSNQWMKVRIHADATAASSFLQIDDGATNTFTRANVDFQYLHIGAIAEVTSGDNATYYADLIAINTP